MLRPTVPRTLALLLLATIGSGCVDSSDPAEGAETSAPDASDPALDPDGTGPGIDPTEIPQDQILVGGGTALACVPPDTKIKVNETRSFQGGAHMHDNWGGQKEIVLYEGPITKFGGGGWFEIPQPGAVVHPGTGRVDFKLWWTAKVPEPVQGAVQPLVEKRTLYYDMPNDERTTANMYALEFTNGQNRSFPIDIANNDPPHATRSSWTFKMSESSDFRIRWTIVRGYDCLPIDPPHYDQWGTETYKLFYEGKTGPHGLTAVCGPPDHVNCGGAGLFYGFTPPGERVVPVGTGRMVVSLTWGDNGGVPVKLGLEIAPPSIKGGSTSAVWKRPTGGQDVGAMGRTWDIPLAAEHWDSQYELKTKWMFNFFIDNGPVLYPIIGDSGRYSGEINWKIELYKAQG